MTQFVLGLLVGAISLWFAAVNKMRFNIYEQKVSAYKEISEKTLQLVIMPHEERKSDPDKFTKKKEQLFEVAYKNLLFMPNEITEKVINIWIKDYNHGSIKVSELANDYSILVSLMKEDLQMSSLSKIIEKVIEKSSQHQKQE